ncbi:protein kinase domain-containing protein [Engelhardtia mirabilis]|uniref:Serine/threonine-protein kinase PrkC n=1 Tax=Engelhardtia mirabilis TaxID=2528011 RepID=A0A518BFR5_9BACT|nr:Serine/threonine-protein kinase PrkC [Planctomycetes bacterium Pla133]QDV00138.1 Serine/threonine-protein kinase PrkC [Planctomycetes bacterium Pla86]
MIQLPLEALGALIGVLAAIAGAVLAVWLVFRLLSLVFTGLGALFTGFGRLVGHVFTCLKGIVVSALRYAGSILTAVVFLPMVLFSIVLGRWSAATHYGRAAGEELRDAALSLYRAAVGYPLRLVGLGGLVAGFESRIPDVIARAPGTDRPSGGSKAFEGYNVVGSLPPGGSGAKLYLATPTDQKAAQLAQAGVRCPDKVVIKAFSIESGSTVPQMMREGRALEAARDLGLVLEHSSDDAGSFHYVMPFVPGDDLGQVTRGLHAASGTDGLNDTALRAAVGYGSGLLEILSRFHRAGLWHKDIKPNNIIVSGQRVELVDLGLVTPLASAMTLTTHGTEYYRDPELVRLAMQGVKVQDVDGVKFDLYSAGAVLYNLVENEFPAHGSLSKITRRCPDALRWIIRRSMADLKSRYASAEEMHGDLRALLAADKPFDVKPAQLPSMGGAAAPPIESFEDDGRPELAGLHPVPPTAGAPIPPNAEPAPGELEFETRSSRKRRDRAHKRRQKAPMGFMAFIGVTLAVLMIPGCLGMMFLGAARVTHGDHLQASVISMPSVRFNSPMPPAPQMPSGGSHSMLNDFPGTFPTPPYVPEQLYGQVTSAPEAPAMPSAVRRAMLGAKLERVANPDNWAGAADELARRAEDWVDDLDDHIDHHVLDELEAWTDDLERWADEVDRWADEFDDLEPGEAERFARQVTSMLADKAQWENELASLDARFGDVADACELTDDECTVDASPWADRPTPRVLAIAQRRHAIPRRIAEQMNMAMVDELGWDLVSEDIGSDDPRDEDLVVRARTEAGFSDIDDSEVNGRLGQILVDGDFDVIVRWTWNEESQRVRSHLLLSNGEWNWTSSALSEAQQGLTLAR